MGLVLGRHRVLATIVVGAIVFMLGGTLVAQKPGSVDPTSFALRALAQEAKEKANSVDAELKNVESKIQKLENTTDKIKDKSSKAAIREASSQINALETSMGKLDKDTSSMRTIARKMGKEISKLK